MKTKSLLLLSLVGLFFLSCSWIPVNAQEFIDQKNQELDLKLQLLDSKLDLLDSKIKLWESKPDELDIRLHEIDNQIKNLAFDPQELNSRFNKIDSLIREIEKFKVPPVILEPAIQGKIDSVIREIEKFYVPPIIPEPAIQDREFEYFEDYKSTIMIDPVRLFEGTFQLSYERLLTDRFSVSLSGLATYATEKGLTNYFLSNQEFSYFSTASNSYKEYHGESIAGGGIILQCRDYLLADFPSRRKPPLGLYAAPQLLYRRILITGETREFIDDEWVDKEIKQRLNIFSAGTLIGVRIPVMKVLFIDLFVGGSIRLSKYDKEAGFTKYKQWNNIDFSGVFPTAGIGIGILK